MSIVDRIGCVIYGHEYERVWKLNSKKAEYRCINCGKTIKINLA